MHSKGELIISMTLAETFLLLVFMLWYSVKPPLGPPPVPEYVLRAENIKLKRELEEVKTKLADRDRRLEWWRSRFGQEVPGSEKDFDVFMREFGRGKPKCQDDNVLFDVSLVNGITSFRVLAGSPALSRMLSAEHIDIARDATLTNPSQIDAILNAVKTFRRSIDGRDCRFDYSFAFATNEDYRTGRERFEKYFFPAGQRQVKEPTAH